MCFNYSSGVHASTVPGHPCVRLGSRVRRILERKFKGCGHLRFKTFALLFVCVYVHFTPFLISLLRRLNMDLSSECKTDQFDFTYCVPHTI